MTIVLTKEQVKALSIDRSLRDGVNFALRPKLANYRWVKGVLHVMQEGHGNTSPSGYTLDQLKAWNEARVKAYPTAQYNTTAQAIVKFAKRKGLIKPRLVKATKEDYTKYFDLLIFAHKDNEKNQASLEKNWRVSLLIRRKDVAEAEKFIEVCRTKKEQASLVFAFLLVCGQIAVRTERSLP